MYIPSTDTLLTRRDLFDIYPVQNLLDIARNRTDAVDERSYLLHSGDQVSLRGHEDGVWFSCWGSGSLCEARGCPGRDRPFINNDRRSYVDCRGEVFYIYAENRRRGERIQSGDTVALMYSYMNDNYYYVSCHDPGFWSLFNRDAVKTMTSPGSTYRDGNPNISWRYTGENFKITTYNTATTYIEDRQVIQLENEARGRYLHFRNGVLSRLIRCSDYTGLDSRFQIFKRFSPFAHQYQP